MNKIGIYLDNCCFNRPYDDQDSIIIRLETDAKLYIQEKIKNGEYELVWSYMLDYENKFNPDKGKKKLIEEWKNLCNTDVEENKEIISDIEKYGIYGKDAVHLSCAVSAKAVFFITTDYRLIRKCKNINLIRVINPVDFIRYKEETDAND